MNRLLICLAVAISALAQGPPAPIPYTPLDHVELVLFSDFQCPFCRQFSQAIRTLQTQGIPGLQTTITFKNFPLSFHPDSQLAHQAALAAGEQGKFWEMHDLLFGNQGALKRDNLLGYAKTLGLDLGRFQKDMDSERIKQAIERDKAEGAKLGVTGTPSFFIDGKEYVGVRSLQELKELVGGEKLLKRALAEIPETAMSRGPAQAPVTIEFFADLESPVSQPALAVVEEALRQFPSGVRLQFHNFPLAFHPQAPLAHEAAMAAAREGRFWAFIPFILEHQASLQEQDLIALAGRVGLDPASFAAALHDHRYAPRVEVDVAEGQKRGLRGSPVVFVNARRIDGVPSPKVLREFIEAELSLKAAVK